MAVNQQEAKLTVMSQPEVKVGMNQPVGQVVSLNLLEAKGEVTNQLLG